MMIRNRNLAIALALLITPITLLCSLYYNRFIIPTVFLAAAITGYCGILALRWGYRQSRESAFDQKTLELWKQIDRRKKIVNTLPVPKADETNIQRGKDNKTYGLALILLSLALLTAVAYPLHLPGYLILILAVVVVASYCRHSMHIKFYIWGLAAFIILMGAVPLLAKFVISELFGSMAGNIVFIVILILEATVLLLINSDNKDVEDRTLTYAATILLLLENTIYESSRTSTTTLVCFAIIYIAVVYLSYADEDWKKMKTKEKKQEDDDDNLLSNLLEQDLSKENRKTLEEIQGKLAKPPKVKEESRAWMSGRGSMKLHNISKLLKHLINIDEW